MNDAEAFASAVSRGNWTKLPLVIGGRYGISSKDFTPAMAKAVFDELKSSNPRTSFSVGINDVWHGLNPGGSSTAQQRAGIAWVPDCVEYQAKGER